MTERPHVFIATPCYGGLVTQGYMQSVIALMTQAAPHGVDLSLGMLGHDALITRSRNTLLVPLPARDGGVAYPVHRLRISPSR